MRHLRSTFKVLKFVGSLSKRNRFYCTQSTVRVRFAPSPTGFLHLGGLRTALYNYLFAKSRGGVFILRIEDTDQKRLVEGATEQLQYDLRWIGIIPDEGPSSGGNYGPYKQSERLHIYRMEAEQLIESKKAYHCFCTEKRLNLIRKEAVRLQQVPKYDNKCRNLSKEEVNTKLKNGEKCCIRFKLTPGDQTCNDLIYGSITHDVASLEGDPVILKSDGYPTYHLANVVDDHYMNISHVLRGVEWLPSTTKHILLYQAFGWEPPLYGHLPLLINADGTKFSKRQGAITVESYRNSGIYPRALINFVTFTGGFSRLKGDPHEPRTYSIYELIEFFHLSYINTQPCRLMFDQLPEFNRAEMSRQISDENSLKQLIIELRELVIETISIQISVVNTEISMYDLQLDDEHLSFVLKWCPSRVTQLKDLVKPNFMFIWIQPSYQQINISNVLQYKEKLMILIAELNEIEEFTQIAIKDKLKTFCKSENLEFSKFMKTLRQCLSGLEEGPGVAEIMELLGKKTTCARLKRVNESPTQPDKNTCCPK
ncbi:putative glutamate--tRNA ligase, mitochondrial [Lycorma delicatula]|uniref:putative glutamate--tRNA ligase, mitochondrial n=1 Tax=Lycorma delicatula TaxID=130591 RepID=UPI003F514765